MNDKKYTYTLYIILVVICCTIGIQIYWNFKNYLFNKQQLIKDVQISLDKAVDDYYTDLAEKTTLGLEFNDDSENMKSNHDDFITNVARSIDSVNKNHGSLKSLRFNMDSLKGLKIYRGIEADSIMRVQNDTNIKARINFPESDQNQWKNTKDTLNLSKFKILTSKIVFSIRSDSVNMNQIDSLLKGDLTRKNIPIDYHLQFLEAQAVHHDKKVIEKDSIHATNQLSVVSNSSFLPKGSSLKIYFDNINWAVFKRIISGVIISLILVLAVISCLFYLLHIINNQKQLAEIKNDLISNITHEFKTPIATIGVALESIKNFRAIEDKEKTTQYLNISEDHLGKLNLMVEKLLETATLDSNHLDLKKEKTDIKSMVEHVVE